MKMIFLRPVFFLVLFLGVLPAWGCQAVDVNLPSGEQVIQTPNALPEGNIPLLPTATTAPAEQTTPTPFSLPTVASSPTAFPVLQQLTQGGCCVRPFWSPDSLRVLFLDKPSPEAAAGFWSVSVTGGQPELFTSRLGEYSRDMQWIAFPENGETVVEHLESGQRWTIPSGGEPVSFSPDASLLAWVRGDNGPPFDTARREIWVSRVDGSEAQMVAAVIGGGFAGWIDSERILLVGRQQAGDPMQAYRAFDLTTGETTLLAQGTRLRSGLLSPQGSWLAYSVTFNPDTSQNGLWIVSTHGGEARRVDVFGAYRWRDDGRLLVIPLDLAGGEYQLWQVDATTRAVVQRTDPAATSFRIANGDWQVSPDGRHIVFVSAEDRNLWLLTIPGG